MILSGMNILFLGSSVTYGSAAGGVSFVEILAEKCGFRFVKEAVSGTTLADINEKSYVARLKQLDSKMHFDLLVCQLSTNDATRNISIAQTESAIRAIVSYAKETFACPIVFYTNPYYESKAYAELVVLLHALSAELGFSVLDFYGKTVTEADRAAYMADRIHPTKKGYGEWIAPTFEDFLKDLN